MHLQLPAASTTMIQLGLAWSEKEFNSRTCWTLARNGSQTSISFKTKLRYPVRKFLLSDTDDRVRRFREALRGPLVSSTLRSEFNASMA